MRRTWRTKADGRGRKEEAVDKEGIAENEGGTTVNKGWMSMNKAKKREKFLHSLDISAGVVW